MQNAMRDLEQIQEQGDERRPRPLWLVGLLLVVTLGLVLAMGMWMGEIGTAEAPEADPLAPLAHAPEMPPVEAVEPDPLPAVDREELSFPEALAEAEPERPEVAVVIAAAAAELAHPEPIGAPAPELPIAQPLPAIVQPLPAIVPAAVAAGPDAQTLARTAARDPMVAAALPPAPTNEVAMGHEGNYMVQVISYDSPEGARAFADGLRARGHHAYVISAELEGRGTVYRVRIGPFETMHEADAYRREFERSERMNTIVIRRRETEDAAHASASPRT